MSRSLTPYRKDKPSYLKEMLTHEWSLYGLLGAVAGGAALSFVSGGLAVVPMLGFLAAEGVASLFIPSSPWWRQKVDKKYREKHRSKLRDYLIGEIGKRGDLSDGVPQWRTYNRLLERVESLEQTAAAKMTNITEDDVERLHDTVVNYLSLWLMTIVMYERQRAFRDKRVDDKLKRIERGLADERVKGADRTRLERAKRDLEKIVERSSSVATQLAAAESGMLTLADSLEEVYQNVMRNPTSDEVRSYLDTAIETMRIEDNLDVEAEMDLERAFEQLEAEMGA